MSVSFIAVLDFSFPGAESKPFRLRENSPIDRNFCCHLVCATHMSVDGQKASHRGSQRTVQIERVWFYYYFKLKNLFRYFLLLIFIFISFCSSTIRFILYFILFSSARYFLSIYISI